MPQYTWEPQDCPLKVIYTLENISSNALTKDTFPNLLSFDATKNIVVLTGDGTNFKESGKEYEFRLVAKSVLDSL